MITARPLKDTNFATAICDAADAVGDLVYVNGNIVGGSYQATKADPTSTKIPAVAVIVYKITTTKAVIQFDGNVNVYTGLTAGKTYYVSSAGRPSLIPPSAPVAGRAFVQPIGVALDTNLLQFKPSKQMIILTG